MITFRKIHAAIITLLILITGSVHANYSNSSDCGENNNCCIPTCNCAKGFISADFLYWRAYQNGLDTCVCNKSCNTITCNGTIISKVRGETKDLHFKWDAGYRLGTGYERIGNGWDVAVYWTHFHSHARRRQNSDNSHHWKLKYDVVDLIVGNKFGENTCVTWKPFIGLRAAQIQEKLRSGLINNCAASSLNFSAEFDTLSAFSSDLAFTRSRDKQKFKGIGPLLGLEAIWNMGCGFSLYAAAAFGTLYGNYRVRFQEWDVFSLGAEFCKLKSRLHSCQAFTEAEIGVRWQACLCGSQLTLELGLEQQRYFDHNRLTSYGDLCLGGAYFSAGVAF